MLKEIRNLLSFLTVLPVGMDQNFLMDAAKYMPLFPLVGAFIGSLGGIFAWLLSHILPEPIVGMLTLGLLLLITGLHHTDGLLDFGDGVMYHGPSEKKLEVMHDPRTGVGGLTLGLVTLSTTAFSIAGLSLGIIIQSLIVSEALAKLAMVIDASVGKSAHKGMNTYFVEAMHGQHRRLRLLTALIVSIGIAITLLWIPGLIAAITGLATCLVIIGVSNRHFGGVTGDVMGATNELTRMASLMTILAVVRWL